MLFTASLAHAQEAAFELRYQAPPSCPTSAEFEERVAARVEHGQPARGVLARRMTVRIEQEEGGAEYSGELRFLDRNLQLVTREVTGKTCNEVSDALVLMTTLALNAQQPVKPEQPVQLGPNVLSPQPVPMLPKPAELVVAPATDLAPQREWLLRPAAMATVDAMIGPQPAYGGEVGLSVARSRKAPRLQVRLRYATPGVVQEEDFDQRARFDLAAAGVAWCAAAVGQPTLLATVCPTVQVGAMWGAGRGSVVITRPDADRKLWAVGGILGRLEFELSGALYFDAQAEVLTCLACPAFSYENPRIEMSYTRTLGLAAGAGLGVWLE